jgi:hypothetical protein
MRGYGTYNRELPEKDNIGGPIQIVRYLASPKVWRHIGHNIRDISVLALAIFNLLRSLFWTRAFAFSSGRKDQKETLSLKLRR